MSTTSINVKTFLPKVDNHQQETQQQNGTPQFSPFSSLPGLAPITTIHAVSPLENQAALSCKREDEIKVKDYAEVAVHVTREVFTIRTERDDENVYLNERLHQLEARQGLVTLSTQSRDVADSSGDQGKELLSQEAVLDKTLDQSSGPGESVQEDFELFNTPVKALVDFSLQDKERVGRDKSAVTTFIPQINGNSLPKCNVQFKNDCIFTLNNDKKAEKTIIPEVSSYAEEPLRKAEINTDLHTQQSTGEFKAQQAATTKVDAAVFTDGIGETIITRDNSTQTEDITPSVDFYLLEQSRLACNGWGVHRHDDNNLSIPKPVSDCSLGETGRQQTKDQAKRSSCEAKSTLFSKTTKLNPTKSIGPIIYSNVVNCSTQTRSPGIKPSSQQIKKLLQSKTSNVQQTRGGFSVHFNNEHHNGKSVNYPTHSLPSCMKTSPSPDDSLISLSAHSTPWGSVSTTPRAHNNTPDPLNSSRSASVLSDSGTSSSIPFVIINSSKTFTNRIQQSKLRSGMAAVGSNSSSTQTTPPLTGRDNAESPPTSPKAPTLKVEYVTKVWDAYISDFLLASDHIKDAAIFDRVTSTCIAASIDFLITAEEFQQLQRSLNSLVEATLNGVTLQGKRYKTFLADGRRGLMAKGAEHSGCSACQTRTLVLVAVHDHTGKPARCNEEVMRLGDFFWAKGL